MLKCVQAQSSVYRDHPRITYIFGLPPSRLPRSSLLKGMVVERAALSQDASTRSTRLRVRCGTDVRPTHLPVIPYWCNWGHVQLGKLGMFVSHPWQNGPFARLL